MSPISIENFGAALAALSALAAAAFGLLDSSKAFWGGVSNVGLPHIRKALAPFQPALEAAVAGGVWWEMVRANWLNGMAKADQKARVRALLKLGLTEATAPSLAISALVDPAVLARVARKIAEGQELSEQEFNVFGRMNAAVDAVLDGAFERADQQYRNVSKMLAGVTAIVVSAAAQLVWAATMSNPPSFAVAIGVGLLAVPVAPVAKDLTSALSAAMQALKAARTL